MSFTVDILQDFTKFKNYLTFDREIEEIVDLAKNETPYAPHLYFNRWEVCWITIMEPINRLLSWIFECFATLFACCGCNSTERLFTILGKQQVRDIRQLVAQKTYQTDFLVPSMNAHSFWSGNLYLNDPLNIDEIADDRVKLFTFKNGQKLNTEAQEIYREIEGRITQRLDPNAPKMIALFSGIKAPLLLQTLPFYSPYGLCRGKATLFQYLYLKTKHLFTDPFNHFIAVGRQFEKGAPEKADLMQNFSDLSLSCGLLQQRIVKLFSFFKNEFQSPEAIQRFKNLNPGFYSVNLMNHHVHYIKIDDSIGFLWNPNAEIGGISVSGPNQAERLLKEFDKITTKADEYVQIDLVEMDEAEPAQSAKNVA